MHKIGRADSPLCKCSPVVQNAAHILQCRMVVGGEARVAQSFVGQFMILCGKSGRERGRERGRKFIFIYTLHLETRGGG